MRLKIAFKRLGEFFMRRMDLVKSLDKLSALFNNLRVDRTLFVMADMIRRPPGSPNKQTNHSKFFEVFSELSIAHSNFNEVDKQIITLLELNAVFDPEFWASTLGGLSEAKRNEGYSNIRELQHSAEMLSLQLPKIIKLLDRESKSELSKRNGFKDKSSATLTLILPEDANTSASPNRISMVMDGITLLYNVHAQLLGKEQDKLVVVGCDSGSDKSFDFLGVAKVVEQVKETFFGVWDRIRFNKNEKFSATSANFIEGLGVIEKISSLESEDKISPEDAQRLKHSYLSGIQKLYDGGAIIPELNDLPKEEPRKLFTPQQRRLAAPIAKPKKKKNNKKTNLKKKRREEE